MMNYKLTKITVASLVLLFVAADLACGQNSNSSGIGFPAPETNFTSVTASGPKVPVEADSEFPAFIMPGEEPEENEAKGRGEFAGPLVTTVSSLLVVLALFGAFVWISRRFSTPGKASGSLPESVVQNLGSTAIDAKTRVSFLRVGSRILVIGQNQQGDPQTLSEITDPEEVERLTNRCLGRPEIVGRRGASRPGSAASHPGPAASLRDLAAG